ncbi:MAG: paraquat-inducible protein A, partial [Candidimonas sp.]
MPMRAGGRAYCSRCGGLLFQQGRMSLDVSVALITTALVMFAIANAFPIISVSLQGKTVDATLPGALWLIWRQDHGLVAAMTGMFAFWLPLTQLLFLLWALLCLRSGRLPADFHYGLRVIDVISPWSMMPVLMLAILVAVVKFSSLAMLAP